MDMTGMIEKPEKVAEEAPEPGTPRVMRASLSLDHGSALIQWPHHVSRKDYRQLSAWLGVIMSNIDESIKDDAEFGG